MCYSSPCYVNCAVQVLLQHIYCNNSKNVVCSNNYYYVHTWHMFRRHFSLRCIKQQQKTCLYEAFLVVVSTQDTTIEGQVFLARV